MKKLLAVVLLFLFPVLGICQRQTTSINGVAGPFTFTGSGVSCVGLVCTFSSSGGTGTVTTVSSGNLSPLFTVAITNPTTTPAFAFTLSNAAQNSIFAGPPTGGAGAPSYQTAPTFALTNATGLPAAQLLSGSLVNTMAATTQSQADNSTKLATTAYTDLAVSNAVAGVNPAVAVLAASTANLTGTYTQVGGGIGDTFTVTATGAFTLDGIAINTIGQRVLLKDQSTASQNGVYTATIVGTTGISPVFTRALDYDTPSDVNNTGSIPVQSGTANTTTSWLLTSQVTSIGAAGSSLTYAKFSIAPSTLVTASSPGVGIAHFAGSTQNVTSSAVNLASADVTGLLPNANLANTATTVNGQTCTLGSTCTVSTSPIGASISWTNCTYSSATDTCTTTGAVASITAASIPSGTCTDLSISMRGQSSSGSSDFIATQYNGDTGNHYNISGGSMATATTWNAFTTMAGASAFLVNFASSSSTGNPGSGSCRIFDYAGTSFNKQWTCEDTYNHSTFMNTEVATGEWLSTSAITSILLKLNSGANIVSGSKFQVKCAQ